MEPSKRKIRVLVVDDSALMRKLISNLLERDEDIEVIATAIDGYFALSKVAHLRPDVVTLDVDMPRMDGITALSEMVSKHRIPVIMLSALTTRGASLTMQALEKGAVDFVCKPRSPAHVGEMADELLSKVKGAARSNLVALSPTGHKSPSRKKTAAREKKKNANGKVIAVGASSGGPHALRYLLPRLPADLDACVLIVQHMPESFTSMMARWLDDICDLEVREARDGDFALPGRALIAPGNRHMRVERVPAGCKVVLDDGPLVNGHRPSVDVLFKAVAEQFGQGAMGLIMTGMGSDGAQGLAEIRKRGGQTVAQDKESCSVFGMPRAALDRGSVQRVLSLPELPAYLVAEVGRMVDLEESYAGTR
jgi:two-component system chemotaxis response regulator CheB